jgi:predicted nucleic acid-binding protein
LKPDIHNPHMPQRSFIDTNILVYAQSQDEPHKQRRALDLLHELHKTATGVISTQVLQEFANIAIKKLGLPAHNVREQLLFWERFEVVQITPTIIHTALDIHQTRRLGFYDSLIRASAQIANCAALYSEDMNAGEVVGGVKLINPFV